MPIIKLPFPDIGETPEESILMLQDVIIKFRKELLFVLANLDNDNIASTITIGGGTGGEPAKAITFYLDGFTVTREDDSIEEWTFETNLDGYITQLNNTTDLKAIPITWTGTAKP